MYFRNLYRTSAARMIWSCLQRHRVITMSIFYTSGVKTFVNEFAAYDELGKLIDNKATFYNWTENYNRTWSYTGDLDITFHPDNVVFNTTDVLYYGYIQVSVSLPLFFWRTMKWKMYSNFEILGSAISIEIGVELWYSLLCSTLSCGLNLYYDIVMKVQKILLIWGC